MRNVIGIDAGGTKTVALLADESGKVHAEARGDGANLQVQGELGVEKVLYEVTAALDARGPIDAVCLGMAGVDRPGERELIRDVLRRLGLGRCMRIENDAFIALVAGAPEHTGIVVVAGTGSVAFGIDAAGTTARSGGWGYLLGDEGSAYWLGHAAVRRAIRAADGRDQPTAMGEKVATKLGRSLPAGLVSWFYDQQHFRHRVAELAPLVEEAAVEGDGAALDLLAHAAHHLAVAARAVAGQLRLPATFPLVLAGGAFRACPSLGPRLEACLDLSGAAVRRLDVEPATGAVTLALDALATTPAGDVP